MVALAGAGTDLATIAAGDLIELLREHGAILLSGFRVDRDQFVGFTELLSAEFVPHPNPMRRPVDGDPLTSLVDAGMQAIPFHSELAYTPTSPDLLWFRCVVPPAEGGQTLLCDGVALAAKMSRSDRELFEQRDLMFQFDLGRGFLALSGTTPERLADELCGQPGIEVESSPDMIRTRYRTSAFRATQYDRERAFANSVLLFSRTPMFQPCISMADGDPLPADTIDRIATLADDLTLSVTWRPGDVLLVDNTRMMHGRRPFDDQRRELHARLGRSRGTVGPWSG